MKITMLNQREEDDPKDQQEKENKVKNSVFISKTVSNENKSINNTESICPNGAEAHIVALISNGLS
jgi:hypothetical protein